MAHVAFDLDRALGFFELVSPLAFLWSKDFLENPEQGQPNSTLRISRKLDLSLQRARETFAKSLLANPNLLYTVLRPDLDALMLPLIQAKKDGVLKSIIIYSNTGVSYSVELAKLLIESLYKVKGLFSLVADRWHPLRVSDYDGDFIEPRKTIGTLQKLFRRATHSRKDVPLGNILFVDDRLPKHDLQAQEAWGLTYLRVEPFVPKVSVAQREQLLFLAVSALDRHGLLRSTEYQESGFCNRKIPYNATHLYPISGFQTLLTYVKLSMNSEIDPPTDWRRFTPLIKKTVATYLQNIQP